MIGFLWNLTFRKILGPLDGVKTKLGVLVVGLAQIVGVVLSIVPSLGASPAWQSVVVIGTKVGTVLAGLGLIDKASKLTDALDGTSRL